MDINSYNFEDLVEGMEISIKREITYEKIKEFSEITGDFHPLHTNLEFARKKSFKNIIAHGMLISSFSSALIGMKIAGKNMVLLSQNFNYLKPIYPNTIIKISGTVKRKIQSLGIAIVKITITNEDAVEVSNGEIKLKMTN